MRGNEAGDMVRGAKGRGEGGRGEEGRNRVGPPMNLSSRLGGDIAWRVRGQGT